MVAIVMTLEGHNVAVSSWFDSFSQDIASKLAKMFWFKSLVSKLSSHWSEYYLSGRHLSTFWQVSSTDVLWIYLAFVICNVAVTVWCKQKKKQELQCNYFYLQRNFMQVQIGWITHAKHRLNWRN